jgi:hypothetical protein
LGAIYLYRSDAGDDTTCVLTVALSPERRKVYPPGAELCGMWRTAPLPRLVPSLNVTP